MVDYRDAAAEEKAERARIRIHVYEELQGIIDL